MFFMLIAFYILPFIIVVVALVDIIRNEFNQSHNKLVWIIVVILLPVIGSVLYYFIGRKQKIERYLD
ncbi:MAG: cytochrome bd-type quinol oxidase subunit 2 [Roseivirga sp.]|jgi:cytochrome bd-type quinol oxidase subunit 2